MVTVPMTYKQNVALCYKTIHNFIRKFKIFRTGRGKKDNMKEMVKAMIKLFSKPNKLKKTLSNIKKKTATTSDYY